MKIQFQRARENGGHGPPPVGAGPPLHGARGFPLAPAFAWCAHGHLGGFLGPRAPLFFAVDRAAGFARQLFFVIVLCTPGSFSRSPGHCCFYFLVLLAATSIGWLPAALTC